MREKCDFLSIRNFDVAHFAVLIRISNFRSTVRIALGHPSSKYYEYFSTRCAAESVTRDAGTGILTLAQFRLSAFRDPRARIVGRERFFLALRRPYWSDGCA
jgi:hypothetical protein